PHARGRLAPQDHRHLPLRLEAEAFVERVLVLREQEETRYGLEIRMFQHEIQEAFSDPAPLMGRANDDVPDRGSIGTIGDDAREAAEMSSVPRGEQRTGSVERATHVRARTV